MALCGRTTHRASMFPGTTSRFSSLVALKRLCLYGAPSIPTYTVVVASDCCKDNVNGPIINVLTEYREWKYGQVRQIWSNTDSRN